MKSLLSVFLAFFISSQVTNNASAQEWTIEILPGAAYNFDSEIRFSQDGANDHSLYGKFNTDPFDWPIHYSARIRRDGDSAGWELELIHHKIYLSNPDDVVSEFNVTHGFNIVTANYVYEHNAIQLRSGLGGVLAHAENVVNGSRLDEQSGLLNLGYSFGGIGAQLGAAYKIPLNRGWSLVAESKYEIAYSRIKIANGIAEFWQSSLHFLAGFGYSW